MDETIVRVRVRGSRGEKTISAVVDTGLTNTVIQRRLAEDLGIKFMDEDELVLANGTREKVKIVSAELEIEDIRRFVPVYIYEQNLIGLTTLEAAGLRVNPISQLLENFPGKLLSIYSNNMQLVSEHVKNSTILMDEH